MGVQSSMSQLTSIDDTRIDSLKELVSPAELMNQFSSSELQQQLIFDTRQAASRIIHEKDGRLLVVVGPCSIHDPQAGLEYAQKLRALKERFSDELLIVMRTYFEKPRTTIGWKGLINDPHLDSSFDISEGLVRARRFLLDVLSQGLGTATEFLDPISPQYLADLICWGAIGARTTESQVHRELASGLSMPIGFKNGTSGNTNIVIDAILSAKEPHRFLSISKSGGISFVTTKGNLDCHTILRGGTDSPNFDSSSVAAISQSLTKAQLPQAIMIDCSHANSRKDYLQQSAVAKSVAQQISDGNRSIRGIMLESFLVEGKQDIGNGQELRYGQSITDGCIDWSATEQILQTLSESIKIRQRSI